MDMGVLIFAAASGFVHFWFGIFEGLQSSWAGAYQFTVDRERMDPSQNDGAVGVDGFAVDLQRNR